MQISDFDYLTSPNLEPVVWAPERFGRVSPWWRHVPFAFWLIANSEPRLLVELGAHYGVSYAAFCEAVLRLQLPTRCYAVDNWQGDPHAGACGEDVYAGLKEFHDKRYASFSLLMRGTLDEACGDFTDGSIDLFHIDGFHTYEAVRHDFETWRPKLSSRAVVLLHDTNDSRRDFGVRRLLDELKREAAVFEFLHEHGLGVVAVGADAPEAVKRLCALTDETAITTVRKRFSLLGRRWTAEQERSNLAARARGVEANPHALEKASALKDRHIADLRNVPAKAHAQNDKADRRVEQLDRDLETRARVLQAASGQDAAQILDLWSILARTQKQKDELSEHVQRLEQNLQLAKQEASPLVDTARRNIDDDNVRRLAALKRNDLSGRIPPQLSGWRWLSPGRRKKQRRLVRDYRLIAQSPLFDREWYLAKNPDVALRAEDPVLHYLLHGAHEGRAPGPDFDAAGYLKANPDLASLEVNPLLHYIRHGSNENRRSNVGVDGCRNTLTSTQPDRVSIAVRQESIRSVDNDHSLAVPFGYVVKPKTAHGRVAAIIHIYYDELAVELRDYLRNIPGEVDVFVTTTDVDRKLAIETAFASWASGTVEVRVTPNCGRDIGPKLVGFRDVYDRYDFVLHLHSKRSPTWLQYGARWRRHLLESLVGTPLVVSSIFEAFERNLRLGMVAAQQYEPARNWVRWFDNLDHARRLAARMGFSIDPGAVLDFPSGSMFWARTAALRPLLELELTMDEFEPENDQRDGTLAHAVERMYFHVCEKAGFDWIKVTRQELTIDTPAAVNVEDEYELKRFFQRHVFRLHEQQDVLPQNGAGKGCIIDGAPFDEQFYLDYHPDVRQAVERGDFKSGKEHYRSFGFEEGRATQHDISQLLPRRFGVGVEPVGLRRWDSLEAKIKPVQGRLCPDRRPTTNVFIPTMDPDIFFGGYIAFFQFLCRLAEAGTRLRFVVLDDYCDLHWFLKGIAGRLRWVKAFENAEFTNMTIRDRPLDINEDDAVIVYSAWMALLARSVAPLLKSGRVAFFVQEFESAFHEYDSFAFLVNSAYRVPHVPIFNTRALHDYFKKHRIGAFDNSDEDQLSFEHSIGVLPPTRRGERPIGKRLLFYARPEAHAARNLFEIGILALRAALGAGIIDESWEVVGIGSLVQYHVKLDEAGKFIIPILPRVPEHEYQTFINGFDVGLSLMSSPHPGVVHFEWAVRGIPTVVICTPERNRCFFDSYDLPIVPADPDIDGIVRALAKAIELARRGYTPRGDASRSLASSWDKSFSSQFIARVIAACAIPIESEVEVIA